MRPVILVKDPVLLQNTISDTIYSKDASCEEQMGKTSVFFHNSITLPFADNLSIEEYLAVGKHFDKIDDRIWDWFDKVIEGSPEINCQPYRVVNDYDNPRKKWPSIHGGWNFEKDRFPPQYALRQADFLKFIKKNGLYVEFTLAHIIQLSGFPAFHTGNFDDGWGGGHNIFLSRKKNGDLCWIMADIREFERYESEQFYEIRLFDFEPNSALPSRLPYLLSTKGLYVQVIM